MCTHFADEKVELNQLTGQGPTASMWKHQATESGAPPKAWTEKNDLIHAMESFSLNLASSYFFLILVYKQVRLFNLKIGY